jgi:hypothetical protein
MTFIPSTRRQFLIALTVTIAVITFVLWPNSPPAKAKALLPLMKELEQHKTAHGKYPTTFEAIHSFTQLTQHFRVYLGFRDSETMTITWKPHEVSAHDFTVLIQESRYQIFLPVGRIKMYSFSSFPVWKYESDTHQWHEGRIHWSLQGVYWSEE